MSELSSSSENEESGASPTMSSFLSALPVPPFLKFGKIPMLSQGWWKYNIPFGGTAPVIFEGTVKLHGCHASVVIDADNNISLQSRNRIVTKKNELYHSQSEINSGFHHFIIGTPLRQTSVIQLARVFKPRYQQLQNQYIRITGEYCGPRIHSGSGISNISRRIWVVFEIALVEKIGEETRIIERADLKEMRFTCFPYVLNVYMITNFHTFTVLWDGSSSTKQPLLEELQQQTEDVGKLCPVAANLGVRGYGEGIVWTVRGGPDDSTYSVKTKSSIFIRPRRNGGESTKRPSDARNLERLAGHVITPERMDQAMAYLEELNICPYETSLSIPLVVAWICKDVHEEENMEALFRVFQVYNQKRANKYIGNQAVILFRHRIMDRKDLPPLSPLTPVHTPIFASLEPHPPPRDPLSPPPLTSEMPTLESIVKFFGFILLSRFVVALLW